MILLLGLGVNDINNGVKPHCRKIYFPPFYFAAVCMSYKWLLPVRLWIGVTLMPGCGVTLIPDGVTMVGVTTLIPDMAVVVVLLPAMLMPPIVVSIFLEATAAAARAAMPLIWPPDVVGVAKA